MNKQQVLKVLQVGNYYSNIFQGIQKSLSHLYELHISNLVFVYY